MDQHLTLKEEQYYNLILKQCRLYPGSNIIITQEIFHPASTYLKLNIHARKKLPASLAISKNSKTAITPTNSLLGPLSHRPGAKKPKLGIRPGTYPAPELEGHVRAIFTLSNPGIVHRFKKIRNMSYS